MSHQTFKVCILIDDNVENFYIKHYIDEINPIFNRFKNQVFTRNPGINTTNLKIYWIDSEDDKILVSCEEDFRLYIEQGKGRKIFFCSNTGSQQQNEEEPSIEVVPLESEDVEQKSERKCRKLHKEEEKKRRHEKKLAEKLKHYQELVRKEEERHSRNRTSEKRECKNAERLECAKRRVEKFRSIIASIDPANLNSSFEAENSTQSAASASSSTSTSANNSAPTANEPPNLNDLLLSPETTRLLSNAIAGCLQPCNVINKVLNEVFAMIPQMIPLPEEQVAATQTAVPTAHSEQQTMEVPKQSAATNTSDANTPVPVRQANDEIEALFKEAAKELEKMNEIVKNSNKMETSSTSSTNTGVTQIERIYPNITDSVFSDSTMVNSSELNEEAQNQDMTDSTVMINTPSKSLGRSRESSIEVHDVGSIMSDDSRDWTILSIDHEEVVEPPPTPATPARIFDPKTGAVPKAAKSVDSSSQVNVDEIVASESKRDSIKSVTTETQTAISILSDLQQQQLQASVQKSIDIVRKSIQSIQKSVDVSPPPEEEKNNENPAAAATASNTPPTSYGFNQNLYPSLQTAAPVAAAVPVATAPAVVAAPVTPVAAARTSGPTVNLILGPSVPEQSQANMKAAESPKPRFSPAVIVYDPNPKINASVHTMMQMGFTNEDNWLTQLLLNVDGDIPKALNFLTPQPKNKKP